MLSMLLLFLSNIEDQIKWLPFFFFILQQEYSSDLNNKALDGLKVILCEMLSAKNLPDCV